MKQIIINIPEQSEGMIETFWPDLSNQEIAGCLVSVLLNLIYEISPQNFDLNFDSILEYIFKVYNEIKEEAQEK